MHLVRGMSSLSTKKRKAKNKIDMTAMERDWRAYNKDMRRKHMHSLQFETLQEYVDYRMGTRKYKPKEFKTYEPKESPPRRETTHYPSLSTESIPGSGTKKESPVYSGDYIIGYRDNAQVKNLVPVGRGR